MTGSEWLKHAISVYANIYANERENRHVEGSQTVGQAWDNVERAINFLYLPEPKFQPGDIVVADPYTAPYSKPVTCVVLCRYDDSTYRLAALGRSHESGLDGLPARCIRKAEAFEVSRARND